MFDENLLQMLDDLVQTSDDRTRGFADAANGADGAKLKVFFQQGAIESSTAGIELRSLVQRLCGTPWTADTFADAADCRCAQAKSIGESGTSALEQLARSGDKAKVTYAKALLAGFPQSMRSVLQRHHDDIARNLDLIADLLARTRVAEIRDTLVEGAVASGRGPQPGMEGQAAIEQAKSG